MNPATLAPPDRSLDQRMQALLRANGIRTQRAKLKKSIKAGRDRAEFIVVRPPEWAETMKVRELLLAVPKVGPIKADRILKVCQMSSSKTLAGMSERQRKMLLGELGEVSNV